MVSLVSFSSWMRYNNIWFSCNKLSRQQAPSRGQGLCRLSAPYELHKNWVIGTHILKWLHSNVVKILYDSNPLCVSRGFTIFAIDTNSGKNATACDLQNSLNQQCRRPVSLFLSDTVRHEIFELGFSREYQFTRFIKDIHLWYQKSHSILTVTDWGISNLFNAKGGTSESGVILSKKKKNNHIQEKHCDRLGDERFRWYKVSSESLAPRTDCPHWTSLCRKGVIQFLKTTGLLGYFGDNGCGSITKVFGAAVRHGPLTASEGTKQHRYGFSLPHSGYEDVEASLGTTLERFKPITKLCLKIEHAQQTHY